MSSVPDPESGSDHDDQEDPDEGGGGVNSQNLRTNLKTVRDPTKTAYDLLPSGESIGSFANKHAVARYRSKIEGKRQRARETRKQKKKNNHKKKKTA